MKKFHDYFDDSSSSGDEAGMLSSLSGKYINYIINIIKRLSDDSLKTGNTVFLLHDLGNRVLHSQQVNEIYYKNLKPRYLENNNFILTHNQLNELLLEFVHKRKDYLDKDFVTAIVQNPRKLMQNLTQGNIEYLGVDKYSDQYISHSLESLKNNLSKFTREKLELACKKESSALPLTKIIAQKLIDIGWTSKRYYTEMTSGTTIPQQKIKSFEAGKNLLEKNNVLPNTAANCLAKEMYDFLKEKSKSIESPYTRKTLKNQFAFDYNIDGTDEYTAPKFFVNNKLVHRSLKRDMKNIDIWTEKKHDSVKTQYSYKFPISKKIFKEDVLFIEEHEVSATTRQSFVKQLGKYKKDSSKKTDKVTKKLDFVQEIEVLKNNNTASDKDIAQSLLNIIKNGTQNIIRDSESLYRMAYLLFGSEVNRNPASLFTNAMFLELIVAGYTNTERKTYNFQYLPGLTEDGKKNLGEGLPMAMRGAVEAMRRFNHLYKKYLSSKFNYDYGGDEITTENPTLAFNTLIARESKVFKDWLDLIKNGETLDITQIVPILIEAINKWYGIDLSNLLENESTIGTGKSTKVVEQKVDQEYYSKLQLQAELQDALTLISNKKDNISSITPKVKSVLEKVQLFIKGDTQNAFNQKDSKNYQYQATDIVVIQNQMMKDDQSNFTINQPIGDANEINKFLEALLTNLNNDKPSLCAYNIGNYHWVVFAVIQDASGVIVLYKDSLGHSNNDLQEKIKMVNKDAKFIYHEQKEQTQGLECGIFALKNMQIISEQLKTNKDSFIKNFTEFKDFCTLKQAQEFRQDEFPKQYVLGKCEEIRQADANLNKSYAVREHHHSEVDLISKVLSESGKFAGLTIKPLKHSANLNKEEHSIIAIEIGIDSLDEHNNYDYSYRIYLTNNIIDKSDDIIEALKITIGDYTSKNNEITITAEKLASLIKQEKKMEIGKIEIPEYEIKIEELCDKLSILNEQSTNKVKEIINIKKDIVLEGSEAQKELDIDWINSYFSKYTLDGLDNILDLRLNDLKLNDIKTLQGIFVDQEHNNIIELLSKIINTKVQTTLVPLDLFNKHAAGLIFERNKDNSIQVRYLDSENKPIPVELEQIFNKYHLNIKQLKVEQQKYANCGLEVIENFILYLTGKRVSQEKAIELHSKLVENSLLNVESSSGIHLSFEESANNYIYTEDYQKQSQNYNNLFYNDDYENHQRDVAGDIILSH
jgi:hypothetical protein